MIVCIAPKAISDSEKREKVLFLAMLIANKFIPEQEFNKIWEEIRMIIDEIKVLKYAKLDGMKEGLEKGLEQGLEKGLEQGRYEEKIEIVQKALKKKLPVEVIANISGLTIEEAQTIEKESFESL